MITKIKNIVPALAVFAAAPFMSAADDAPDAVAPAVSAAKTQITPEQRQLFLQGLGWLIGQQSGLIQDLRISKADAPAVAEGFRLALLGEGKEIPPAIMQANEDYAAFIGELQANAMKEIEAEMKKAADENKKLGAEFIAKTQAENKDFAALPSGILMKTIKAGDPAKKPTLNDTISVRYTGKLIDGTIFDSSARGDDGEPVQFTPGEGRAAALPLGRLIPAWVEALPMIGVGGQCTLIVPAELAYGDRGNAAIPPGSTLVFDLELDGIVDKTAEAQDADAEDEDAKDDADETEYALPQE